MPFLYITKHQFCHHWTCTKKFIIFDCFGKDIIELPILVDFSTIELVLTKWWYIFDYQHLSIDEDMTELPILAIFRLGWFHSWTRIKKTIIFAYWFFEIGEDMTELPILAIFSFDNFTIELTLKKMIIFAYWFIGIGEDLIELPILDNIRLWF